VPGAVIGAHFGEYGSWSRYHTGIDFRASHGTPIRAVKAGVVVYAGNSGDWAGTHVAIKHGDGKTTMSSHMSSMAVHAGQTVQAGQIIGRVGETGRAFGAHLHFELYPAGVKYGDVYKAINPQPWLKDNGVTTH
jgi:murein DD-endopeptidase MepM/ murein hydrolase activator NlpD